MTVTKIDGGGFQARLGDFFGPIQPSAEEARKGLEKELTLYRPLDHHYIRCGDGTVLHICQVPTHGWNYYIVPPTGFIGEGRKGGPTYQDALTRALTHAGEQFGGVIGRVA